MQRFITEHTDGPDDEASRGAELNPYGDTPCLRLPCDFFSRPQTMHFCTETKDANGAIALLRLYFWFARYASDGSVAGRIDCLPSVMGLQVATHDLLNILRRTGIVGTDGVLAGWHWLSADDSPEPEWHTKYLRYDGFQSPRYSTAATTIPEPTVAVIGMDLRDKVVARDGAFCRYCGRGVVEGGGSEIDHVIPRSRGGTNDATNLVVSCKTCNRSKGARTPEEAGLSLKPIPRVK